MCTAVTLSGSDGVVLLGRTMDFSFPLQPAFHRIPAGSLWHSQTGLVRRRTRCTFLGTAQDLPPLIFADGVNECGLGAAMLYFAGYAVYDSAPAAGSSETVIAANEVVSFLLGLCSTIDEALEIFSRTRIIGIPDRITGTPAPFHWMLADRTGRCVVIEKSADGLHFQENPIGVLTNSPDFGWHLTNLRNYMNLVPTQGKSVQWNASVTLAPFGQGQGSFGLPGSFTSPDRFVRAAWLKSHVTGLSDSASTLRAGFHILQNVSLPKGCVVTERGTKDYTQYIVFYNLATGEYFFRDYDHVYPAG